MMSELPVFLSYVHGKPHAGSNRASRILSMMASSAYTRDEFPESSAIDQILLFPLSSELDNDISGCSSSEAQGQDGLESVCRQTITQRYITRSKSKTEDVAQKGKFQKKS